VTRFQAQAGRGGAILILALSLGGGVVRAQDEDDYWFEPPTLPESINGVVRPGDGVVNKNKINQLRDVFKAVHACWRPPAGSGFSGQEITLRLSFKRSGEIIGKPRITFYKPGTVQDQREAFTRSVREAFERCTPLPFSEDFGAAIAGRPFTFRFIDARPL
jgi:hypothetical protein